jgi:hypothetical protein
MIMKHIIKPIGIICCILVLFMSFGCGDRAYNWATSQAYGFATSASNLAATAILLRIFPELATVTTTTTTGAGG